MAFRSQLKIRFGDIDRAGIVYYPRFMHYFHVALEEFFAGSWELSIMTWWRPTASACPPFTCRRILAARSAMGTISRWKSPYLRSAAAPLLLATGYLKKARQNRGLWPTT